MCAPIQFRIESIVFQWHQSLLLRFSLSLEFVHEEVRMDEDRESVT